MREYETVLHNMRPTADHIDGLRDLATRYIRPGNIVIEVGSFAGTSAKILCDALCGGGVLYCIDGWEQTWPGGLSVIQLAERDFDKFAARNPVVKKIKSKSEQAVRLFADHGADFVYIDSDHTYEHVVQEIGLWRPKVRSGGVLSGHDYHKDWPGVIRAVDEFFPSAEKFRDFSWAVTL